MSPIEMSTDSVWTAKSTCTSLWIPFQIFLRYLDKNSYPKKCLVKYAKIPHFCRYGLLKLKILIPYKFGKILLFRFLINEPTCLILLDSASEQVSIQLLKCLKIYFIAGFTKYSYPTTKIATQENIPVTDFQEILLVID